MLTPQERLAKKRRKNMPIEEAVMLLLQDTDLETEGDAREWLELTMKRRVSLETGPGRVDYDQLLERAKDGATRDLWFERNRFFSVPFAVRHIADSTGMPYADALDHLRGMVGVSLYFYDQNGELMACLFPGAMPVEEWDSDGLLIGAHELVRILNYDGIRLPDEWPEWLKQPSHAALVEAERARMAEREEAPAPTETPEMTGSDAAGTEEAKKKPGRPANTDYAAIGAEMRRRFENDEELPTLEAESNQLETWAKNWAKQQVPTGKPSAAGQIRKRFRGLYKTLESAKIEKKKADEMTK